MPEKYSVGLTIHNFEADGSFLELESLLDNGIVPEYIIYHQNRFKRAILEFVHDLRNPTLRAKRKSITQRLPNIKIYNIADINSADAKAVFDSYEMSIVICNSGIIKKSTLEHNKVIFINRHASELPKYRGVNNIQWALWFDDEVYGTVMRMSRGIDEGDILWQQKLATNIKNYKSLSKYLTAAKLELFSQMGIAIRSYIDGKSEFKPQPNVGISTEQWYSMHPLLLRTLLAKYNMEK